MTTKDELYYYSIRNMVIEATSGRAVCKLLKTIVETQVYTQDTGERKAIISSAFGDKFIHIKLHMLLMVLYKLGVR